ncbi:MAG: ethanolamine ammonia-lyase subunit EutC [Siphonobacter sp.]
MSEQLKRINTEDDWQSLKAFTDARIALGRTGVSIPLRESLQFKLAHAHAKDAVYSALHFDQLTITLESAGLQTHTVQSKAPNRDTYLQRPDLGRVLNHQSSQKLRELSLPESDLSIIVADGLSAAAVNENAWPVIQFLIEKATAKGYSLAPIILAEQARVAIADEIGSLLKARMTIILIGERPGLSSFDSMGAYLTFAPKPGLTDERRNCISNIREKGLPPPLAADKIMYLIDGAFRLQLSGVMLKDTDDSSLLNQ